MNRFKPVKIAQRLWCWFIAPSPQIKDQAQRRQATLLSAILLAIVVLGLISEFIGFVLYGWKYYITDQLATGTALLLAIYYGISRTRYGRLAAILSVVTIIMAIFGIGWIDSGWVFAGLFDFMVIPIWLGSLYLNPAGLLLLIVANLVALLTFRFLVPEVPLDYILIGPFSFLLITSFIPFLITWHRNLLEQDRRVELEEKEQNSRLESMFGMQSPATGLTVPPGHTKRPWLISSNSLAHISTRMLSKYFWL